MASQQVVIRTRRRKFGKGTNYKRCPRCHGSGRVRAYRKRK